MKIKEECLVEIYSNDNNLDSFSVGEVIFQDNDIVLFRLLNPQGQWDGFSFYKKEYISDIGYNTDYLKKLNLYIQYWNEQKPINKLIDCITKYSFFDALKEFYENKTLLTIVTNSQSNNIFTGYINTISANSIILDCLDSSSATFDEQIEISLKLIAIVTYDDIDNLLLNFAFNKTYHK